MSVKILLRLLFLQLSIYPLLCSADTQLDELLQPFTQISSVHFSYTETRRSLFFKKAQISSGEIQFIRPDIVIKQLLKPEQKKFVINKNLLTLYHADNKQTQLTINDYPQLKHFVALIKAILSGNAHYLRQHYDSSIKNLPHAWLLTLSPKILPDEVTQRSIQSIQISGVNDRIQTINMHGFAGEQSELNIDKMIKKVNNVTSEK